MKMLEDLEEVVRYADDPSSRTDAAFVSALRFIRTHHAPIRDMAARLEAAEKDAEKWRRHVADLGKEHSHFCQCGHYYSPEQDESEDCPACGFDGITKAMQETGR